MDFFEETLTSDFEMTKEGQSRLGFGRLSQTMSPNEKAAFELYKTLENYGEFTQQARRQIQNEFVDFDDLSVLNMETMSAVLSFLHFNPDLLVEDFKDKNIVNYFQRLLPNNISSTEKKRLIIRLKAEFIKYIIAIKQHRIVDEDDEF